MTAKSLAWLPEEMRELVTKATEAQIVSLVLYGEARAEPVQGIVAVGCVIRNRVKADLHNDKKPDWWGEKYSGVCTAPWQFSCLTPKGGEKNYKAVLALANRMVSGLPVNGEHERQCIWIAHGIIGDYALDNVKASFHYHSASMIPRPKWAQGHTPVTQIGAHVFYNDVK